mgnify:CR=1 FL=1
MVSLIMIMMIERTNQILEDAGYTLADDGYRYKDGEKLTVRFLANKDKDSLDSLIPVLQKCLNAIGIDFKANTVEFNTVINTVQDDAQTDSWDATYLVSLMAHQTIQALTLF